MRNPWLKKNPALSMWLSGANAVVGSLRGRAAAQAKRQAAIAMRKGTAQLARMWGIAPSGRARSGKKKSR